MEKYARLAHERPKIFIGIIVILNLIALFGILRFRIDTDVRSIWKGESRYEKILREMEKIFGSSDQIGILIRIPDVTSPKSLERILSLQKEIEKVDGVEKVVGIPEKIIFGFNVREIEKIGSVEAKRILDILDASPIKRYGKDWFFLSVLTSSGVNPRSLISSIESVLKGVDHSISGNPYAEAVMFDYILYVIFILIPIIITFVLSVFAFKLGSFKAALLSIAPAGIAAAWSLGTMGWVSGKLSLINVLVPIFTVILGSADGLHFTSHYLESERGLSGVVETLRTVGIAMIMTTLTTMAGFLSFLFIPAEGIQKLGVYSAVGMGYAAISTWLFLPVVLPRSKISGKPRKGEQVFFKKVGRFWWLITLSLILVFSFGILKLNESFSLIGMYRRWTSVRKSFEEIKRVTGFGIPAFAIGEFKDPLSSENAERILSFEKEAESRGYVEYAFSIYDIVENFAKKLMKTEGYPKNAKFIYLLLRRMDPSSVDSMVRGETVRILMSVDEDSDLTNLESLAKEYGLTVTGIPYVFKELNGKVVSSQLQSILFALLMVWGMMSLSTRRVIDSSLSIIPISATMVLLFGFMGYSKIPLNVTTAMMGGLVIGVGVDYAIHYTTLHRKLGREKALEKASTPIFANALGLAIGYTPMVFSPLTIHLYLMAIMWVTMIGSATLTLLILPRIVR